MYLLNDSQGNERQDILLKVLHGNSITGSLEREWAIGRALHVLENPQTGELQGFMKTFELLRDERAGQKPIGRLSDM